VRDGDPFLFGMFLIGLMKWKMPPVYISVTGSVLFAPESEHKGLVMKVYVLGLKALGSAAWRPLYSAGVWRKNVTLIAQNKRAVEAFQKTAHGVFRDKVVKVERGVEIVGMRAGKELSRQDLGIHPLRFTLLSFGAPHQGKNLEIVFGAVARTPHIQILHGGLHSYSLGGNPAEMAVRFGLNGRATVHDRFVLEKEKPLFFGAADAVVLSYTRVFQSTSSMLYDAAAFGVPVIASDNSPLGELVKENGLGIVFKAEDVRSLVEAIEKFRGLEWGKVEEMKRNCLRFAKENGIDRWARECVKLFEGGREKSGEMVERKWGKGA
jgi:glycosyltransferase involved in cell wall biosynthesis